MQGGSTASVRVTHAVRALTIREKQECRDWQCYAERTVAYAFGVGGDIA